MQPDVTTVLDRDDFPRPHSVGRVWKLVRTSRGFKPSRKPAFGLQAVPTAGGLLAAAGDGCSQLS